MRTNPRTCIMQALQEGPRPYLVLENLVEEALLGRYEMCGPAGYCMRNPGPVTARHLCHLIRSRYVVRRPDGLYELRRRTPRRSVHFEPLTIPAGTLKVGDAIQITGTISVRRQGAEGEDVIVVKVREAPRIDHQDFDPSTGLYFPRRSS